MTISKLQYRWHMDKRAVEAAIEEWSNEQLAALLVSISRLLQQRLESRDPSPQSEWSTVTSVAPGGKGYSGHSTAAGSSETAHPPIQTAPPLKGKGKGLQMPFQCNFCCSHCGWACTRNKWGHTNHRCYQHRRM